MLNVDDVKIMNHQTYRNIYSQTSVCKELATQSFKL